MPIKTEDYEKELFDNGYVGVYDSCCSFGKSVGDLE